MRELLQNALDAAVAAGEPTAIVHFAVRTVRTADIPGCDEYRDALGSAVESQTRRSVNGVLPDNAQQVVDTITAALDRDTCSVLVILDNGIGLDATSMDALLSDGTSAKQDAATGSYGNGHMVAIPASDLRYVLYGGVKQDATRIGAGHAVLASHTRAGDGPRRDADGYLVRGVGGGGEGHLYDYAAGKAVPPLIQRELDIIAERWGHGTAIVVPAFNSFREQRTALWDLVSLSAACSFFAAVHQGRLRIEVAEPGTASVRVLDSETLAAVLEYHKERKRRRSRSALSGARAFGAWETLKTGSRHDLHGFLRHPRALRNRRNIMTHIVSAALALLRKDYGEDDGEEGWRTHGNLKALAEYFEAQGLPLWVDDFHPERVATALYPHLFPQSGEEDD